VGEGQNGQTFNYCGEGAGGGTGGGDSSLTLRWGMTISKRKTERKEGERASIVLAPTNFEVGGGQGSS